MALYTPAAAANLLQVAASSIRNYCNDRRIQPHLSTTATPQPGQPRQLTAQDLKVLAFVHHHTRAGATLEATAARIDAELDTFDWSPPGAQDPDAEATQPAALILAHAMTAQLERLQATQAEMHAELIASARALAGAQATIDAQREEIARLTALLDNRQELEELRRQVSQPDRPGLFARLFARRASQ